MFYTIGRVPPRINTVLHSGFVLRQPPPHHIHASDFSQARWYPDQPRTFQPCAGTSVASVSSFIAGASQIIIIRPAAFVQRTGKTTFADLRSVRLRGKRSRLWHGQLGIEPTARGFGDRVATLEHLPLYPAFTDSSRRLLRVLSNARFNAGKSNGPSRSHALLTGQIWTHPAGNGFPALSPCTLSALGLGADGWTRTSDQWHSIAYPFAR